MEIQFLIIIFAILLLIFITTNNLYKGNNTNNVNNEHFDARVGGISKEQCGNLCTAIIGCGGFAYDDRNGSCYLSKNAILGRPINSLFASDYSPYFYRCNKTQPITDYTDLVSPNLLKRNSLYFCSNSEQGRYDLNIIAETMRKQIGDFDELDKINIPEYRMIDDFKWPDTKDEILFQKPQGNGFTVFERSKDEYLGQYLYPSKCIDKVDEQTCLKICDSDPRCLGTEWNPYYLRNKDDGSVEVYENICCPKMKVMEIITRRPQFKNGNFYIKTNTERLNKESIYVTDKTEY